MLSPLIGREAEVADLVARIRTGQHRLITLTGPGGVGKSRLAIEVARTLADAYGENLAFVSLAHVTDSDDVIPVIAQAIDVREQSGHSLFEAVTVAVSSQPFLLVLDNLEQVVDAADALARLLELAPELTIVATSQIRLRVSGEMEFSVPALSVDDSNRDLKAVGQSGAVLLFVERARSVQDGFDLTSSNVDAVVGICRALDGLPLAIELAAARIKILTPELLLDRLDKRLSILTGGGRNLPLRQQTMRNAIEWSYELLTAEEQGLLRRLAVFRGGISLSAAMAISDDPDADLDLLSSLADKSLIRRFDQGSLEPRYYMFETIREFSLEKLAESGVETDARSRHAHSVLTLAQESRAQWMTATSHRLVQAIDIELANMRTAFAWFETSGEFASGLRLAAALDWFWDASLGYREGLSWIERFLPAVDELDPEAQVYSLRCAAFMNMRLQNHAPATAYAGAALEIARTVGKRRTMIDALSGAGAVNAESGQYDASIAFFGEMMELSRLENYQRGIAVATHNMGLVAFASGDVELARSMAEAALEIDRKSGNLYSLLNCLNSLAMVLIQMGEIQQAAEYMREQFDIAETEGVETGVTLAALVATYIGNYADATQLLGANLEIAEQIGSTVYGSSLANRVFDPVLETLQETLGEAEFARQLAIGRSLDRASQVAIARAVVNVVLESSDVPQPHPVLEPAGGVSHDLSPRELEVLRELAKGLSNQEIADALFISVPTVKVHVRSILTKLNLSSRTAAAAWAIKAGLN